MYPKKRVAVMSTPMLGGVYRHYQHLRKYLFDEGWELQAISVGADQDNWDATLADESCVRLGSPRNGLEGAKDLVDWIIENDISAIICVRNALPYTALPHLPEHVVAISRCFSTNLHSYQIVMHNQDRAGVLVATSKRQEMDLQRLGVPDRKVKLIPHSVDLARYKKLDRIQDTKALRLGYIGRLDDASKGILLLPTVLRHLDDLGVRYSLRIVGGGPDEAVLKRRLREHEQRNLVQFRGTVPHDMVAKELNEIDILLMPSRYEGFGLSLVEAMAAGVVPVVSRIAGVTDWILGTAQGEAGVLCDVGQPLAFAEAVCHLDRDRKRLHRMADNARNAAQFFCARKMAHSYSRLLEEAIETHHPIPPRPWSEYSPHPAIPRGVNALARRCVRPIRNYMRKARGIPWIR